ncbi:MAG: serine/threonine-protein kinase [Gemmatimonadota bacterium]
MHQTEVERLNAAFDRVIDAAPADREALIADVCAGDAGLERRLRALLSHDASGDTPLDATFERVVATALDGDEAGAQVGPYRIVREIGRGGMGAVYQAERVDGAFEQTVALKLVKRGMDTDDVLRRFRAERQILADLQHPNIARLHDGGAASDGRPYLVMEYIDGDHITRWADAHRLSLERRLDLFRDVCAAVRFAHRNLVVHRDLKPSNILVMEDGTVKLLDFGIAKLLGSAADDLTRTEHRVLTPAYAAPEQRSAGGAVTTATDVYALGVVLHELLTGQRPDPERRTLPSKTASDKPSSGAATEGADTSTVGANRATTPDRLRMALRGDLDAILLKATAPDPDERYESVDGLLDDLERFREARPVGARLPTRSYHLHRFVQRNRGPLAAVSGIVLALFAGLAVAFQQRNAARAERDTAQAVAAYLEGMFESVNPVGRDPGADTLRVVDFLERATASALEDLAGQPALQARLLSTLGRAHFSLFDFETAQELWERAVAERSKAGLPPDPGVIRSLGEVALERSDWVSADRLLPQALEAARQVADDTARAQVLSLMARGHLYRDDFDAAEAELAEAVPLLRALGREELLANALYMQAGLAYERGDAGSAVGPQREGLALFRRLRGDDAQAGVGFTNLAVMQRAQGDLEAADSSFRAALEILDGAVPDDAVPAVAALAEYANLLSARGQNERADSLFQLATSRGAGDERRLAVILTNHGQHRLRVGDVESGLALSRRAVEVAMRVYGESAAVTAGLRIGVARALDAAGDSTGAEHEYEATLAVVGSGGPLGIRVAAARGAARALSRQGQHAAAEQAMRNVLEETPDGAPPGSAVFRLRQATLREMVAMYERWGRSEEAERIRALQRDEADRVDEGR